MASQAKLSIAGALLACLVLLMMLHAATAHRHMLQEVPAAAQDTLPTPPAQTTDSVEGAPELETEAIPGGRAGYDYPDRIPGPPQVDPSRQGMYKGMYRWDHTVNNQARRS
jgi:hypothetical protein